MRLGRPAVAGDTVTWNNVRIDVTATAGRGVASAIVHLVADREGPPYRDAGAKPS